VGFTVYNNLHSAKATSGDSDKKCKLQGKKAGSPTFLFIKNVRKIKTSVKNTFFVL